METSAVTKRLSPVNFNAITTKTGIMEESVNDIDASIMSGAQFAEKREFNSEGRSTLITPLIIDFRHLLKSTKDSSNSSNTDMIQGISNKDLLHGVVALYSVSLPDMAPETIYSSVCEKWARTVVLIKDVKDTLSELEASKIKNKSKQSSSENAESKVSENECRVKEDKYEPEETKPGIFAEVFSDSEAEDNEEEDSEEEEDYTKGIQSFLSTVDLRRKARLHYKGHLQSSHVGIENRLVAAATFEKAYCNKSQDKVVHLTLIAVRNRYRKLGIGRYMMQQIKEPKVVGSFDAVVVHADNSAKDFFARYGFSDDIILNSRWIELAEEYTNCTLMSYLPPYSDQTILGGKCPELDIVAMEQETKKWREKSRDAHLAQLSMMTRLRNEVIHLRAVVSSQQELIARLSAENENMHHDKFLKEKDFLEYKLATAKALLEKQTSEEFGSSSDEPDEISTQELISEMEKELGKKEVVKKSPRKESSGFNSADTTRYRLYVNEGDGMYDHGKDTEAFYKITQQFQASLKKDPSVIGIHEVSMIQKALPNPILVENYELCTRSLHDQNTTMLLYYCGSLENPYRLPEILKNGFSEEDFSHGEYGRGLYFSQYASSAAHFSQIGKILIAEVALGKTESVLIKERTRTAAASGFDSILIPGRLASNEPSHVGDYNCKQEYVVFNVNQAIPKNLLEYTEM